MDTPTPRARPWRQIDSRVLLQHPHLTVLEDSVVLPDGRQIEWVRFAQERDFVLVVCIDEGMRVLVARQYCHPPAQVVHEFPGGYANVGESYQEAARRELAEETGVFAHRLDWIGAFLAHRRRTAVKGHVFVATGLEYRQPAPEQEEFIDLEWLSIARVEDLIRNGAANDAHFIACWTLFRLRRPGYLGAPEA